jgi:hypothetical protein
MLDRSARVRVTFHAETGDQPHRAAIGLGERVALAATYRDHDTAQIFGRRRHET